MGRDLTWGGEHTVHYADDVSQDCTAEANILLLTKVTPVISIEIYILTNTKHINFVI